MKIKSIAIRGFRGFNKLRTIDMHDQLTLIYAPNSYGKTSISEAIEWLLYGITSKVDRADTIGEYRGSYRNCHFPKSTPAFVYVKLMDNGKAVKLTGILTESEGIRRLVNGQEVNKWPFRQDFESAPKPFILQHALKYLLLSTPDKRFQGFARILGLEELDQLQKNVVSLCTKPEARIPKVAQELLNKVSEMEIRLKSLPTLTKIHKAFKKGVKGLDRTYQLIEDECVLRVPPDTPGELILSQLSKIRKEAVDKIFKGQISLPEYKDQEREFNSVEEKFFLGFVTDELINRYTKLIALSAIKEIIDRVNFFDLGFNLMEKVPEKCPFCSRKIDNTLMEHIQSEHKSLISDKKDKEELVIERTAILKALETFKNRLVNYQDAHKKKGAQLLSLEPSLEKLKSILLPKFSTINDAVVNAISDIKTSQDQLEKSYNKVTESLEHVNRSLSESKEDSELMRALGKSLTRYISDSKVYVGVVNKHSSAMLEADKILQNELDALASTEDLSTLIELINTRKIIEKSFEIGEVLKSLKVLKNSVDKYVADKMLSAISEELTSDVMEWYTQIKTIGDPNVHFSGFDLERTTKGEIKARRVQIKAESYGKGLVSAVSSLSESKLNALGLCMNISRNLKGHSPFSFLIIDDPIQSWDADHEAQFVEVINHLIKKGKQVVLMSHNAKWIKMVRSGCRSINGRLYELTGYTEAGPEVTEMQWADWKERLRDVDAISKDQSVTSVKLQQAEEEIRIICTDLTCQIYFKVKGKEKKPHNLNSAKVRKMLLESGVESGLVDRISQTFETTDDAHHAPVDYSANRQRIKRYHAYAHELSQLL